MLSFKLITWIRTIDLYHALTWPQLSYVAEEQGGKIVGYILAKMCARYVSQVFVDLIYNMLAGTKTPLYRLMDTSHPSRSSAPIGD